jgi:hypothetical protein
MSRPGIKPGPPAWEASTVEMSHLDSLFVGYSEPLLGLRLAQRVASTTLIIQKTSFLKFLAPSVILSLASDFVNNLQRICEVILLLDSR